MFSQKDSAAYVMPGFWQTIEKQNTWNGSAIFITSSISETLTKTWRCTNWSFVCLAETLIAVHSAVVAWPCWNHHEVNLEWWRLRIHLYLLPRCAEWFSLTGRLKHDGLIVMQKNSAYPYVLQFSRSKICTFLRIGHPKNSICMTGAWLGSKEKYQMQGGQSLWLSVQYLRPALGTFLIYWTICSQSTYCH